MLQTTKDVAHSNLLEQKYLKSSEMT